MNPNLTEIVMILDQSGSMCPLMKDTIGGYNSFIEEQKKQPGIAHVTTFLFSNGVEKLYDQMPLENVQPLTEKLYMPHGMTALYDAVGFAIDSVGKRLASTPEEQRPSKVIFVITTDGEENCSNRYTAARVKEMIEHQQSKYSWEFLFIGAGIDAYSSSSRIGIDGLHTASYAATTDGLNNVYCSASKGVSSIRCSAGDCGGSGLAADWKCADEEIAKAAVDALLTTATAAVVLDCDLT